MRIAIVIVAVVALGGCSSSDPGPAPQVDAGADVDAPTCTSQKGLDACSRFIDAFCKHVVECCNAGVSCDARCKTTDGTPDSCAFLSCEARVGHCNAPKYQTTVCAEVTAKCVADLPGASCSDILNGTGVLPNSCNAYLAQF